jgi:hypothetical protein
MLIVTIPKTTEVGDTVDVKINGKPRQLELGYDTIRLDGTDQRKILTVMPGNVNMTLVCSDADVVTEVTK